MRLTLIHWNETEAKPRVERLGKLGYHVRWAAPRGAVGLKSLSQPPPDRFLIDLSRLPSHGLAVGIELLKRKASRSVPLVFLGGAPEKVERTRQLLPGAAYLGWEAKDRDLRRAIDAATPCKAPPGARSGAMAQYAKSPLRKKLGIDENTAVLTIGAPGDVREILGIETESTTGDRVLLFVRSCDELMNGFDAALRRVRRGGGLWIMWPKKTSGVRCDITQYVVRARANEAGWADYKICSVDETWSGMLFGPARGK
jgi:hypothetical protein